MPPLPLAVSGDHRPDDGAPRPFLSRPDRRRSTVLSVAVVAVASGIVLVVSELLPVLDAWVLPTLLTALTVVFLLLGRLAAARGSTTGARAWAAWAGVAVAFATFGAVNLAGLGGALVGTLLVVLLLETGIALWFRSGVHFAVVQVLAVAWSVIAHVFGIVPLAGLVAGLAGLWWLGAVGISRTVVATTTIVVPVGVAFVLHPLTHPGAAVDAADVAVLTGAVAVAVTVTAALVTRGRPTTTLWSTARTTVLVVLVAQVVLSAVPGVVAVLAPVTPWPSIGVATAAVASMAALATLRPVRPGTVTVLVLCATVLAQIAAAVTVGTAATTSIGCGLLLVLVAVRLGRGDSTTAARALLWLAVLVLPVVWAVLLALPVPVVAVVLVVAGLVVALAQTDRLAGVER